MDIEKVSEILEPIAKSFPQESQEYKALETACLALLFVSAQKTRNQFEDFIKRKDEPMLGGLQLLQLRVYGIDIPDKQRTPEIMELASEIDALATKLRAATGGISDSWCGEDEAEGHSDYPDE